MFLSSQQGRLRVDDGHGAIAPSLLTSEHRVPCPSTDPPAFSLGLLGFFFYGDGAGRATLTQASPELPAPSACAEVAEGVRARDGGDGSRSRWVWEVTPR